MWLCNAMIFSCLYGITYFICEVDNRFFLDVFYRASCCAILNTDTTKKQAGFTGHSIYFIKVDNCLF